MKKQLVLFLFICQIGKSQSFEGGFNFRIPYNDNSVSAFLPKFPQNPITDTDRVSVLGNNFIVKGKPYKFWGVNVGAAACFQQKVLVDQFVPHMAKMGINLVRLHHLDNPWAGENFSFFKTNGTTRAITPASLDKFEYMTSQFKQNGIYINLNLNVSRTFSKLDGVLDADSLKDFAKGVTIFDPQLIALQKEYAKQILTHVNPYTGLKLIDDPALAVVEIINENTLYGMWKDNQLKTTKQGGNLLVRQDALLTKMWNDFISKKYKNQVELAAAWANTGGVQSVERIANGNFEVPTLNSKWQMENHEGAVATFALDSKEKASGDNSMKIQIDKRGAADWHIQMKYVNFTVKKGQSYVVKLSAKASKVRKLQISMTRDNAPYTYYSGSEVEINTIWKTYKVTLSASEDNDNQARMAFMVGNDEGSIWIDDISMAEPQLLSLESNELLTQKNLRRIDYSERGIYGPQRMADQAEFIINTQKNFMENMRTYLKDTLGVKVPITGTNALTGIQQGLEHENMDYIDDHNYWDHPQFPGIPWDENNWLINNTPNLKTKDGNAISGAMAGINFANKPFTVSEYMHAAPNKYRVEMVPTMTAYSAFHGVDGIMYFDYNTEETIKQDKQQGFFTVANDNSVMSLFPSCAFAYRYGLIKEATPIIVNYSEKDIYNSFKTDGEGRWGKYVPYDKTLQLTNSFQVGSYRSSEVSQLFKIPSPQNNIFITSTNETNLNTSKGLLTTTTPKFLAVTGFLAEAINNNLGNLTIKAAKEFGALTWLSTSNKALIDADTTFLTLSTQMRNSNMIWNVANTSLGKNWGAEPTVMQPIDLKMNLNSKAEYLKLHVLSPTGASLSSKYFKPISKSGDLNTFEITLTQTADKTLWYALEKTSKFIEAVLANEPIEHLKLATFPNPSSDLLNITFEVKSPKNVAISLINSVGQVIFGLSKNYTFAGKKTEQISVKTLVSGVYFLKVDEETTKILVE